MTLLMRHAKITFLCFHSKSLCICQKQLNGNFDSFELNLKVEWPESCISSSDEAHRLPDLVTPPSVRLSTKMSSYQYKDYHYIKVRRSDDRLIFIMGISMAEKTVFILKWGPVGMQCVLDL